MPPKNQKWKLIRKFKNKEKHKNAIKSKSHKVINKLFPVNKLRVNLCVFFVFLFVCGGTQQLQHVLSMCVGVYRRRPADALPRTAKHVPRSMSVH